MRKGNDQMNLLIAEFEKNPNWSYKEKVSIAEKIGMTFH